MNIIGGPQVGMVTLLSMLPNVANSDSICAAYTAYGELSKIGNVLPLIQAMKETANFTSRWWVQFNNPAGIGVTGERGKGEVFYSLSAGIAAQYAHLLAYAVHEAELTDDQEKLIYFDRRLKAMGAALRGSAPTWEELGGKWAPSRDYGTSVIRKFIQYGYSVT